MTINLARHLDPENWGRYQAHAERLDAVVEEVLRLGQTYPQHHYNPHYGDTSCYYNQPGRGQEALPERQGCILGSALINLGHSIPKRHEGHNGDEVVCRVLKLPRSVLDHTFTQRYDREPKPPNAQVDAMMRRLNWLFDVQGAQDREQTWGKAIESRTALGPQVWWHPVVGVIVPEPVASVS